MRYFLDICCFYNYLTSVVVLNVNVNSDYVITKANNRLDISVIKIGIIISLTCDLVRVIFRIFVVARIILLFCCFLMNMFAPITSQPKASNRPNTSVMKTAISKLFTCDLD